MAKIPNFTLQLLDLSYNNLSPDDFLPLGLLQNLRILQLTGNNLKSIPQDLARPHAAEYVLCIQLLGNISTKMNPL